MTRHHGRLRDHGNGAPKASAFVVAKLRECDAALAAVVPRLLAKKVDDEAVHDLRVAIRRMRTLLKMSRRLFGRWHTDVVREAFAQVMRATGDLRDEEVLQETLADASRAPELATWLEGRKAREARLRRTVIARIQRGDLDRARLLLKALLVFPVDPERDLELARFARRTVERARRKVERRRDVDPSNVTGMHDLRIAYKELRYSIELLADALPIDARALLEPATVFQKRLGELHDVDVAIEVVQNAKGLPAAARDETLAALAAMREKRVAKYLRELDPLGADLRAQTKTAELDRTPPAPEQEEGAAKLDRDCADVPTTRGPKTTPP
jgi:CHAD domain-containing protein